MIREIKKRAIILNNRKPFIKEVMDFIDEMNRLDWIYSDMRLDGCDVSRETVNRMIRGEFVVEASVSDHLYVGYCTETMRLVRNMMDFEIDLDRKYLLKLHAALTGEAETQLRSSNPVLMHLRYNPPHFKELDEQLNLMFLWFNNVSWEGNPLAPAVELHNKIIELYPFETHSEGVARAAMYYELMRRGFPPFSIEMKEQDYFDGIAAYIKKNTMAPVYDAMEKSLYNKMEMLMQITDKHRQRPQTGL